MYKNLLRPLLFALSPESAHDLASLLMRWSNIPYVSKALSSCLTVRDSRLQVTVAGLPCANPIGLAAGLDKDASLLGLWSGLGFGHVEIGTVTALAQPGNPKPRIFRLPEDGALINRMGFPSRGSRFVADRLQDYRLCGVRLPILGANIGKSKVTDLDRAVDDYLQTFDLLAPLVDYVTVNVSSPNTPGLRELQERSRLEALLQALQEANVEEKPLLVKVAPDLTDEALEDVVECCLATDVRGIVATNTTLNRAGLRSSYALEQGGLSGQPLGARSLEVVRFLAKSAEGKLDIIGVGGVTCADDVWEMLAAGASAVQIYTGLVYEGPLLVKHLNTQVISFMDAHRCQSVREAAEVWIEENRGVGTRGKHQTSVCL